MDGIAEPALLQLLKEENWEAIAHTLITFDIQLDTNGSDGRKLKKELGFIKNVLYAHIKNREPESTINISFFVGAVKTIKRLERKFERNNEKRTEFLVFLKLLLEKIKKQRVYVKKTMEIRTEFKKMKGVVENEPAPL
jgi:hypothetical protein